VRGIGEVLRMQSKVFPDVVFTASGKSFEIEY